MVRDWPAASVAESDDTDTTSGEFESSCWTLRLNVSWPLLTLVNARSAASVCLFFRLMIPKLKLPGENVALTAAARATSTARTESSTSTR